MIKYDEAVSIIEQTDVELYTEKVSLENCHGEILAEDVYSDIDMPPFDKSAMDGYAIRREDIENELEVIETVKAGDVPVRMVERNTCSKIMTGAMIPQGVDCVIMVEQTETLPNGTIKFTGHNTKNNIAYKAEDIKKGQQVLRKGTMLRPQEIAILATAGCHEPEVYVKPSIGIFSTGDEIVEPYDIPKNGKIRNSNAYQLLAQVQRCGFEASYVGIIGDTPAQIEMMLEIYINKFDVIILTGGISMGEFDYLPEVLQKLSVKLLFQKIAIKPGKPTLFGRKDKGFVFALPGNPVSSYIVFELFAKPLLYRMCGFKYNPLLLSMPFQQDYKIKKSDRLSWIPVELFDDHTVMPVSYHGSAHIFALCKAQGIMPIEPGKEIIRKGELVHVRQI